MYTFLTDLFQIKGKYDSFYIALREINNIIDNSSMNTIRYRSMLSFFFLFLHSTHIKLTR